MSTLAEIQYRAATDADFRQNLIADPRTALESEGLLVPSDISIRVAESTPDEIVLALPPALPDGIELDEDSLAEANGAGTPLVTLVVVLGSATAGGGVTYGALKIAGY